MKFAIQLALLSAASIGLTILFQLVVLTQVGPGAETDAFFAGMTVPQLVLAVISASLTHVLVPLLAGEDPERARQDTWTFLALIVVLFGLIAVVLGLLASWWIPLIVPGFDVAGCDLTAKLTRIQLVGMVFAAVNGVQWAGYHARRKFLWVEAVPCISGLLSLLLLTWALPRFGIVAAAWIATLGMGLQTLLLVPGMGRPASPDFRRVTVLIAWRRIKPLLAGTAYYRTDAIIDRFLLSMAGTGNLSLYHLGQQIYGAANQMLNKSIVSPAVPALSVYHKSGDLAAFLRLYRRKLMQVGLISVSGVAIWAIFGRTLLTPLVVYGRFSGQDMEMLWWIMVWLGAAFLGSSMGQMSSSSLYAAGDTTTPTRLGIYTYTLCIPVKIVLFYIYGIAGLAVATGLFFVSNLLLQNNCIRTKHGVG